MADVRARWLSRRAIFLHLAFLLFVPLCIAATWWQITRAEDGNGLSYLYTFEWPVFAILGVYFWWMFLHTDYDAVGLKGMQKQSRHPTAPADEEPPAMSAPEAEPTVMVATPPSPSRHDSPSHDDSPSRHQIPALDEDPELAAYNARLAALATSGAKTWRKPESPVVRRPR